MAEEVPELDCVTVTMRQVTFLSLFFLQELVSTITAQHTKIIPCVFIIGEFND